MFRIETSFAPRSVPLKLDTYESTVSRGEHLKPPTYQRHSHREIATPSLALTARRPVESEQRFMFRPKGS
jgi:hypothetical protein